MIFAANNGTLGLGDSASFSGTVAGMTGSDSVDLAYINPTTAQTPSYAGDASGGTLRVSDGTRSATIALLGNYLASTFVASSDGHGGTLVSEASQTSTQNPLLTQSHS